MVVATERVYVGQPITNTRVETYTDGRTFNSDVIVKEDDKDNDEGEGWICRSLQLT